MAEESASPASSADSDNGKTRVIILTGPVGAGKTSLINAFLQLRPSGERWAILMNDTGKTQVVVAINNNTNDTTTQQEVEIRTVYGACEASAKTGVPMRTAVLQTLRKKPRPKCFLVELSTLAQPMPLKKLLEQAAGGTATVKVVAMVPQKLHSELWQSKSSATYRKQLEQADVLAVHKCGDEGIATPPAEAEEQTCIINIEQRFPEKDAVIWEFQSSNNNNAPTSSATSSLGQVASELLQSGTRS